MRKCACGRSGLAHCKSPKCDVKVCYPCLKAWSEDFTYFGPIDRIETGYLLKGYGVTPIGDFDTYGEGA